MSGIRRGLRSKVSIHGRPGAVVMGVLLASTAMGSGVAYAQDASPADARSSASQENTVRLETIVVTARKRPENEQTVPISMTVLEGRRLGDVAQTTANASLARSAPNVSFVDVGGQSTNFINVRGVGSFSPVAPDDTSVVFYVDGVPQSVYGVSTNLLDTDRVEILRGPQGTLFGRNSQGGAVNIIPNAPTFDREFTATGEVGSNGYGLGQFVGNGAIIPGQLAGRLALSYSTFGGDIPNVAAGGKDGGLDIGAARGSLLFTPDDRTDAQLTFSYGRENSYSPRFMLLDTPDFPVSATNPRTHVDNENYAVSLKLHHAFDGFDFNSLSSFQRNTSTQLLDPSDGLVFAKVTGLPAAYFNVAGTDLTQADLRENIYVQEFRLSSLPESTVAWTAGVNYFRSELRSIRDGHAATPAFVQTNGIQDNAVTTNSYAAFGEVTVPVVERLSVTFGLRATHEDNSAAYRFSSNGLPGVAPAFSQDASLDSNFVTGRAMLSYQWTPSVMTYASVSRGYVSAGLPAYTVNSAVGKPDQPFPASTSWTYEGGFKSTLLGKRLMLNGSVFFNDIKNGHLVVFNPTQASFGIAALNYRTYGAELEATAKITADFDLFAGIGYTHNELVDIPAASATGARSGNHVPNVPDVTANLGMEYRWSAQPLGLPGGFAGRVVYQHVGARAADVANSFDLAAYDIVNLKLGWQNNGISLYAFANNVTDERYQSWGQSFGTVPTVRVGQGRIVGVGTSLKF